ncbi:MAG: 50S ribosomal protein L10 [Candidatus Poribacteria bacterium]|nr:50S ribosomal protein L10 [Candidatus Poribacteria bacterium]
MGYALETPRPEKVAVVEEIKSLLNGAQSTLLVEMHGLSVAQASDLRNKLREANVNYKVFKNTLLHIATTDAGIVGLEDYLKGPTAIAISPDDPGAAMRVLRTFTKANETVNLQVKAALLGTQVLDATSAAMLADLPTYDQAVAQLAGVLLAPIRGLAISLNGVISGLAIALGQVVEQKGGAEDSAEAAD